RSEKYQNTTNRFFTSSRTLLELVSLFFFSFSPPNKELYRYLLQFRLEKWVSNTRWQPRRHISLWPIRRRSRQLHQFCT
ncbi:Os11g0296001, partial [Oryza sativa Japonica Group]